MSTEKNINNACRVVTWDEPTDARNPKHWSMARKWAATTIVSAFAFISPVASSMVAPALEDIGRDLNVHDSALKALILSIFLLAYALGPLVVGPLSELYGRVPVLQLSNLFFLVFNIGCGFAHTGPQIMICRFFAGLGGSAPLSIGGGVLSDCWHAEQRGRAIAIYSLAPLLGPAIGPIAGAFITANTTWRWIFWGSSLLCLSIQLLGLFFLQETYAPKLLEQKARQLRKQTGDDTWSVDGPKVTALHWARNIQVSLARPFIMLATQPIIMVIAIYMAYCYGLTYLVLSSFPNLFIDLNYYNMSTEMGGLNYFALGLGYVIGAEMTARINDFTYNRLKKRNNNVGSPEFRAPVMIPCSILLPIGFLWYGWTAETHQHWILPDIGAFLIAVGTVSGIQTMQSYIVDAYPRYAASGMAAVMVLRSLAGFGFPLFAPAMYNMLGYGWGNSLLAFVALAIGLPAPFLLWRYGDALRARSKFAAGDATVVYSKHGIDLGVNRGHR
ncbi:major facilitator superfamily domain-containing protein [Talaromyces proteolyticus]|uniref:Major facilitator superfamily domain-containing protein n=1 Tax=Talaromyces proteolyticus TaxID=1131652 RepID=A0AAD4KKR3_9EURO|nr:major facilitator superfamily domain-containing protein [Talaromyces proteolyticus]KAH8690673.1 major facilitator superfamily domain-containing protein [Talaromyces proteolyticus]